MSFSSCFLNLQHSFYSPALWRFEYMYAQNLSNDTSKNTIKTNKQTQRSKMIPETRYPINQSIKNTKKSSKVLIYKMYIICISHSQKTFVLLRSFMSSSRVCGLTCFLVTNDYSTFIACFKTILQLMFLTLTGNGI